MLIERIIQRIRQHFCVHRYSKCYDTGRKCYVYRCVKCGMKIERDRYYGNIID